MDDSDDTNAAIWQSEGIVREWAAGAPQRDRNRAAQLRFMALLLPFGPDEAFTFLDLGAGTGAASRAVLAAYPRSTAILADFSAAMMSAGEQEMEPFAGRYRYTEFDMLAGVWPAEIPAAVDAVVTSMCVHHLPDRRKQGLFAEILDRLVPGGWYLNYDPVRTEDPLVEEAWLRVNDREDPEMAVKRLNRNPQEQARYDNHVRYMIPLGQQLDYLQSAGFEGIDVYLKNLENVIYGGRRPR
ncbi:MAG TPA: class I SAM-dependent methyltransferase [Streptosporangiaceae bacterium]|jgi:SAM-dependent methyltransferase